MDGNSLNITAERILKLKEIFPEVFTEERIDFKRLRDALGEYINFQKENYELSWAGKSSSKADIQKQTTSTLIPQRDNSINFDNTESIFIEGENLEALRILQKSYFGKVKMIYIDPPYNTGNDSFVYPDNFNESSSEYKKRAGFSNEDGFLETENLWQKNTIDGGRFHSAWLSMMYPRLFLARNLLSENGVIFISIDDNEQANLRLLLSEIFGEENFLVQIIWKKRSTPPNDKIIGTNHDYILAYAKNVSKCELNLKQRTEEQLGRYQNPDNHPKGKWTSGDLMANVKGGRFTASLHYPIINPNTGEEHYPSNNGNWRFNKEKIQLLLNNNEIYFGDNGKGRPKLKRFFNDVKDGVTYPSIWDFVPLNSEGTAEIEDYLGNMNIFDTPKPSGLIKELIRLGAGADDIVLDFFGGSCTTAQSVLELNESENTNRKFILVQLAETISENTKAYKNGYANIAEIGRTRIKKVIERLNLTSSKSHGFKSFKVDKSNFNIWRSDIKGKDAILDQLKLFLKSEKPGSTQENMLVELLLKAGKPLTTVIDKIDSDSGTIYCLTDYKICICLDMFNVKIRDKIYDLKPSQVIILNGLFDSDEALSNTKLEFEEVGIKLSLI